MDKEYADINNDPYFKNFINGRNVSSSTEIVYYGRLRAFCEFLGITPAELIKEAQREKGKKVDEYLQDYIENLKKSGKSSNTIINRLDTVKAFYKEHDIDTDSINRIIHPGTDKVVVNEIISPDQIKEALQLSSLRDKAIILLHMSSGMEATELRNLTYGDFINSIREYLDLKRGDEFKVDYIANKLCKMDEIIGTWEIKKYRTGRNYVTFNTPESTRAILSYLIDRKRKNKPIKSLNNPLFVNSRNNALNVSVHGSIFKRVNDRANFGYLTEKRRFFSSTMLRKYFKTKLYESGADEILIKTILGQKLDDNNSYPSNSEIKLLKNKYRSALANLSLDEPKIEHITPEGYKNLLKKLDEKDKKLKTIKKHLEYIKEIIE
ncbi:MAG: tyrosine-type recombinase/integrase [Euryarchaeota archaeon]|nr:tyrosine-type recombinase/integrase [Euryarchaeota archaeon]MBU4608029.1 tyrosine-type recombinase/integrase [Euryarchaeota archaeon]MBV1728870.1 tyrosine-type recombinase/integrase [Methanobacterium sp.]MBV1754880.1 tyrosine-type recombinase/integrase [Methanobacterium sp.]